MELKRPYAPILHTGFADTYDKEQMKRFVGWADSMGYQGISVEGKTASPVPLDKIEDWIEGYMRGLSYAADELEKRGMSLWIFDEWGYPTGTAAGLAMKGHPEYRSKKLHLAIDVTLNEGESVCFTAPKHLISAAAWHTSANVFAGPVGGYEEIAAVDGKLSYTATHKRCRFAAVTWEYDTTRTVGVFEKNPEDDTLCTLDLLSHEAMDSLISVMHERYYKDLGRYFGGVIRGFFYDEPFLSFPYAYTFDLFDEFIEKKGYDPKPLLPRLLTSGDGRLSRDLRDVITTRMSEAFVGRMQAWCHEHGVELTGHQDLDHDVRSLSSVSGDFFKNSKYNDSPGVDYIWAQLRPGIAGDHPRFAGSFARMTGKEHATSESFAATGNCMTPDYMRWAMEHQAVRGIDRFYLMIADPEMREKGYDFPVDPSHKISKYFMADVNRHVESVISLIKGSKPLCEMALYIPRREMESEYPPARANRVSLHMPWEWVNDTVSALITSHIDFDYIWDYVIATSSVDEKGGLAVPDGQVIKTIIIPAVRMLDESVKAKLLEMKSRGGEVIFVGFAAEGFVGSLTATYPHDIGRYVTSPIKMKPGLVSLTARADGRGDEIFFILNETDGVYETDIEIPGLNGRGISVYDFDACAWQGYDCECLRLEPLELKVLRISNENAGTAPAVLGECAELCIQSVTTPNGKKTELDGSDLYFECAEFTGITEYEGRAVIKEAGEYRLSFERLYYAAAVTFEPCTGGEKITKNAAFAPYHADFSFSAGEYDVKIVVLNAAAAEVLGSAEREEASRQNGRFKDIFENDRDFLSAGMGGARLTRIYHS